jgi:hypothetical protein
LKTFLRYWLLSAIIVTGLIFLIYVAAQQVLRLGADDPQIQMAEDIAAKLADGVPVRDVVPAEQVNIASSLAPYIIVFDDRGQSIASSAQLDSHIPTIPAGVFDYVRHNGEDRFTWQPQPGVRTAVVVTRFTGPSSGFVITGRSLREVEKREDGIEQILFVGWIGMLIVTFFATAIIFWRPAKKDKGER